MIETKTITDLELVEKIKKDEDPDSCIQELANRHTGIFVTATSCYESVLNPNTYREIISDKDFYIHNAAKQFDPNRNTKFPTFLFSTVKWACLKEINKKRVPEVYIENNDLDRIADVRSLKNEAENEECQGYLSDLVLSEIKLIKDERAKKILRMRYFYLENKNLPWKIIAKEIDLSIQGCIDIHNKWIKKVYSKINKQLKKEKV